MKKIKILSQAKGIWASKIKQHYLLLKSFKKNVSNVSKDSIQRARRELLDIISCDQYMASDAIDKIAVKIIKQYDKLIAAC